jgi:glycosyltransferase involved in cell wall biosynthesis
MNRNARRVSVGIPVYNGERFIAQTIEAILSQTFQDFELIISDNASTDRTEEICRAYAARDSRVRFYRSDMNRGAAWNHNRVFELATGEFFKWNSADDLCAPEFLARCVAALDQDPTAMMAISETAVIDEDGKGLPPVTVPWLTLMPVVPIGAPPHVRFRQTLQMDHLCMSIYSLIRSEILRQTDLIGGYADSDRNLLAHLALFGHCIVVPGVLVFNRDHTARFSRVYEQDYFQGWRKYTIWFDPSKANRKLFPFWKKSFELWGVIPRSPLRWQERLRCYRVMVQWLLQKSNMRSLYGDATHYPRKWIVRRFPGAKVAWNRLWAQRNLVGQAGSAQAGDNVGSQGAPGGEP